VPTSRLTRITAVALAVSALGAPVADARPGSEPGGNKPGPTTEPVYQEIDHGFDTGSAAVGAGGAAGIVLLTVAGGMAFTRHRHHDHDVRVAS
jgi:hypothetical protein